VDFYLYEREREADRGAAIDDDDVSVAGCLGLLLQQSGMFVV
jgi:hypothetical protein